MYVCFMSLLGINDVYDSVRFVYKLVIIVFIIMRVYTWFEGSYG